MENIEVRILHTSKGYKIDVHEIGALATRTEVRAGSYSSALKAGQRIASGLRASGRFGYVRLMVEELF